MGSLPAAHRGLCDSSGEPMRLLAHLPACGAFTMSRAPAGRGAIEVVLNKCARAADIAVG